MDTDSLTDNIDYSTRASSPSVYETSRPHSPIIEDARLTSSGGSSFYGSIINPGLSLGEVDLNNAGPGYFKVYKRRWYLLLAFSFLSFTQGGLGNVWTVTAHAAEAAFGWSVSQVSTMQAWMYIMYLVAIFPFAWLMDTRGMRLCMILSAACMVIGTGFRCISTTPPYVTWFAHAGHMFIGLAGPVVFTAGPVVSALWFPPRQRATATAIATIMGFAGAAGVFVVGPSIVSNPEYHLNCIRNGISYDNCSNIHQIKDEIIHLRYTDVNCSNSNLGVNENTNLQNTMMFDIILIGIIVGFLMYQCGFCTLIFLAVLIYFPNKPPSAPSLTAAMEKLHLGVSVRNILKRENSNFWLVAVPMAMCTSVYGLWSALFDVNLSHVGIGEAEAGWLGFYAVAAGCASAVVFGRIADIFGNMKLILMVLLTFNALSTYWFILLANDYITMSSWMLYTATIIQGICLNGAIPLYYELGIESTYPVAEMVTSSMLTILYQIPPLIFIALFFIPSLGKHWMNWAMYAVIIGGMPMLACFRERYKRLEVDQQADVKKTITVAIS